MEQSYQPDNIDNLVELAITRFESPRGTSFRVDPEPLSGEDIAALASHYWPAISERDEGLDDHSKAGLKQRQGIAEAVSDTLNEIPELDLDKARAVYATLAESQNPRDRELIAFRLPKLTRIDHDLGLRLWRRLITDEDPEVRFEAYDTLTDSLGAFTGAEVDHELKRDAGLEWHEAFSLIDHHVAALRASSVTAHE